jgi:hypothetical protein
MAKAKASEDPGAAALEQGYVGAVPDEIENDAYTVSGQGADTAKREREQLTDLKVKALQESGDESAAPAAASSSSSSSSSSS